MGYARVQFSSGLSIAEIAVHRSGSRVWATPPSRPWLEDGSVVKDDRGKIKYQTLISFANHGVQASWSRQVIAAVREVHPELFTDADTLV